jgi:hypothetical protein
MPHAADFEVASCQATVFTPELNISGAEFMTRLLQQWAATFDGDPTVLPLPEGVPNEVPKIILQSRSQEWRCEVAPARLNIHWRRLAAERGGLGLDDFYRTATALLQQYRGLVASPIRRVAAVVTRYALQERPGRYLAAHFCQERWLVAPFNRPENFEVHAHKQFMLADGMRTNSWVRTKTGKLSDRDPIVIVEQDLNTLPEETERRFDDGDLASFYNAASTEFDVILRLYFPVDID